jgi:hypothetical protein
MPATLISITPSEKKIPNICRYTIHASYAYHNTYTGPADHKGLDPVKPVLKCTGVDVKGIVGKMGAVRAVF